VLGVPLANPWTFGHGVARMNFGGGQYIDGDNMEMWTEFSQAANAMEPLRLADPEPSA
jgi:hypothetical protein